MSARTILFAAAGALVGAVIAGLLFDAGRGIGVENVVGLSIGAIAGYWLGFTTRGGE